MLKKETITSLLIIFIIFMIGFLVRLESTQLSGISEDKKAFYLDQFDLPYFYDMDSYYNYRITKNFLEHGYLGDEIINGQEYDLHSYYPPGVRMEYPPLIAYLTAFIYNILNKFTEIPLSVVSFWIPLFIAPITGVVAYLFLRRFTNDYGAATAGLITALLPFYFMRTVPGWFDTDMFNIIIPLIIVWGFFEALRSEKKTWILTLSASLGMFLFALAWSGWVYLFYVLMIFCIITIILGKISGKLEGDQLKKISYCALLFLITSLGLIWIFNGFNDIISLLMLPLQSISWGGSDLYYSWPNVYLQVTELQTPSFSDILSGLGPSLLILAILAIIYFIFLFLRRNNTQNKINFLCMFSIFWALCGVLSLLVGIRFIILLAPPLIIITGIFVGLIVNKLSLQGNFQENKFKNLIPILMIFFIVLPSLIVVSDNYHNLNPRMNDDIYQTGGWVNDNTSNNTVIISSWVYGHFFTAIADRPVIIDGASQNSGRAYWINRAFYTNNESLSRGIFRMLANSGDMAYLTLNKYNNNTSEDVEILNSILGVDKVTAGYMLENKYNLTPEQAFNVIEYTHPTNTTPFVVITMNEMIYGGYWIFNYGGWDFNNNNGLQTIYSYGNLEIDNQTLKSDDGITGDLNSKVVLWNNLTPCCVIKVQNGVVEKNFVNESSKFCIILQMDDNLSVVLDQNFENSMFAEMVVEKDETSLFKPIYRKNGVVVWESA